MKDLAIWIQGLTKRYGTRIALNGLDLQVPTGSFFALLGPNGSGKTTLMRLLMGLLRPDAGAAEVLGFPLDLRFPPLALKEQIGYVAQQPALYERMTATELALLCRATHARWAVLRDGRVALAGTVDELKLREKRVRVVGALDEAALASVPGVW